MNLLGTFTRTGSVQKAGKIIGFTHYCLEFEGTPEDMQSIWDFVCNLNKGDAFRQPVDVHPVTHWSKVKFSFSDKGTAAMVKLAFA
jgi:hypothetical protein